MRHRFSILDVTVSGALAAALLSQGFGGCSRSHSVVAPDPPVDEPSLGKMVARVNGLPWESMTTKASPPVVGGQNALYIGGFGDSVHIILSLPGGLPPLGTYSLSQAASQHATCLRLTALGWIGSSTDASHTGSATVTRVDSSSIAGTFRFDAFGGGDPPQVTHISSGAFNVLIERGVVQPQARRTDSGVAP